VGGGSLEPPPSNPGETALSARGAAKSAAIFGVTPDDPELLEVVEAWDDLPPALRAGILAMIRQSGSGEG